MQRLELCKMLSVICVLFVIEWITGCRRCERPYGVAQVELERNVNLAAYFKDSGAVSNVYAYYRRTDPSGDRRLLWMLIGISMEQPDPLSDLEQRCKTLKANDVLKIIDDMQFERFEIETHVEDARNIISGKISELAKDCGYDGVRRALSGCLTEIVSITPGREFYLSESALAYLSQHAMDNRDANVATQISNYYGYYLQDIGRQALWLLVAEEFGGVQAKNKLLQQYASECEVEHLQQSVAHIKCSDWENSQFMIIQIMETCKKHECSRIGELLSSVHRGCNSDRRHKVVQ